jgi:cellulose biosynthesis protein BcsQ
MNNRQQGQIITFYSYKGGTGRTMALANIACILAERQQRNDGKGVLMIDWDLEAPGLHRYFHSKLPGENNNAARIESLHDSEPGLIDLFYELDAKIAHHKSDKNPESSKPQGSSPSSEEWARQTINEVNFQKYIIPTTIKKLSLLKAGRFTFQEPNEYAERVNKFNWEAVYKKSPHLIRVFAEILAEKYAYVLIDSRTGVTDISGICTMLLPEKLVVVFTPNIQSLKGCLDLVRRATDYRKESADLRSLLVFPLVSRIEASQPDLKHDWRFGNPENYTIGYQPEFEKLLAELYEREGIKLTRYFDEMQIQHIPRYAYGEEIAVLAEALGDRLSLRRSYETFANKLIESQPPWEGDIKEQGSQNSQATTTPNLASRLFAYYLSSLRSFSLPHMLPILFILVVVMTYAFSLQNSLRKQLTELQDNKVSLEVQNASLQQQLSELQNPLQIIKNKDQEIKNLFSELAQVSRDRDDAKQDALRSSTQMATAQRALDQANRENKRLVEIVRRCK